MIIVLLVGLLVAGLSGGLAMTSHTERRIAGTHERAARVVYEVESMAVELEGALASVADWSAVPALWLVGPPVAVDPFTARTDALNRSLASRLSAGADTPRWRLAGVRSEAGMAIWIRDDPGEGDGNSAFDTNGCVTARIERWVGHERRALEVTWQRTGGRLQRVAWREE